MSDATAELVSSLRQMVDTNHQILAALNRSLPQWYGVKEMQARWNIGADACRQLVREHTAYQGETGKALSVHLDDVLVIDEVLRLQGLARIAHARRRTA